MGDLTESSEEELLTSELDSAEDTKDFYTSDEETSQAEDNRPVDNTTSKRSMYLDETMYETLKKRIMDREKFVWKDILLSDNNNDEYSIKLFASPGEKYDLSQPLDLKEKLSKAWASLRHERELTSLQTRICGPLESHLDILALGTPISRLEEYRKVYAVHLLNHLLRLRDRILKHQQMKAMLREKKESTLESEHVDSLMRDQGFTRPRVLILVPFRNSAYSIISQLTQTWMAMGGQADQRHRFDQEYGPHGKDNDEVPEDDPTKPAEFNQLFRGNVDDCFRIGIKITRKSMKLFSEFYSADIIVASPLGLKLVIDGQMGGGKKHQRANVKKKTQEPAKKQRKRIVADCDFLSSIDLLIIDQADVLAMQNWEHLTTVIEQLNQIPKDPHGCDFSRVQSIHLDGMSKHVRQSLVFSEFKFPELVTLFNDHFSNCFGATRLALVANSEKYSSKLMRSLPAQIRPEFYQVPPSTLAKKAQTHLDYFTTTILPRYQTCTHVAIFVSSYFDYCQLKQYFASQDLPFASLCEYDSSDQLTGARAKFFNGHVQFLLVTERFYFFKRYRIKGIRSLIFYSLPEYPDYFKQWIGFVHDTISSLDQSSQTKCPASVSILYSVYDYFKLERIVGTEKVKTLLSQ